MSATTAKLVGVGVGPGDPELLTLKAIRVLNEADVIAHFAKAGHPSNARAIVASHLKPGLCELALHFPVTSEVSKESRAYCSKINAFYDDAAAKIASHLDAGRNVAVLCEGDPLFYGSYMHLQVRLAPRYPNDVVAGITGMSGSWSATGIPIAQGDDVFTVLPGTLQECELERRLGDADAVVVIKLGTNLAKVRRALERVGRVEDAIYVERGTTPQAIVLPFAEKQGSEAPYFALVLVPGWEKRR
jgi:precorrin-2/cobalt-factor-2 C20-methyltransferase